MNLLFSLIKKKNRNDTDKSKFRMNFVGNHSIQFNLKNYKYRFYFII